jgi:predicted KAP-like P-loop ATPase
MSQLSRQSQHESVAIFSDEPIANGASDRLRRQPLARRLAQLIDNSIQSELSTVFAVVGPWGSGKSSLVNLTLKEPDPERSKLFPLIRGLWVRSKLFCRTSSIPW